MNLAGIVPFAAGEELARHPTQGWTDAVNEIMAYRSATVTDPVTGFTVRLLPQIDESTTTTDATPTVLATVPLTAGVSYEFSLYAHCYVYADGTQGSRFTATYYFDRLAAGAAVKTDELVGCWRNDAALADPVKLVANGNNVDVVITGDATTRSWRVQVGYVTREIVTV